ncbi:MAG: ribosomal protein S18-alanine N-acetyltransferase [Burkholderiales bacterium]|nr:ribosomal protein S18-alanine N-acetyltransferase [Burkholderiales bacterium]
MKVPELQMLPMTELDLPEILKLDAEIFPFDAWSVSSYRAFIPEGNCWVLKLGPEIQGYAVFTNAVGDSELLHIGIHPQHRQKGLASLMMSFMLEKTLREGTNRWFLEVRESNTAAQNLYRKFGYTRVGRRKAYYKTESGREDALVMRKVRAE